MPPIVHPGRLLKRELLARGLGANRLALDLGMNSTLDDSEPQALLPIHGVVRPSPLLGERIGG
jgi:hypothetical protein